MPFVILKSLVQIFQLFLSKPLEIMGFNGSQLAKKKSTFLTCHCHRNYRVEAVGLKKKCNCTLKITIFVSMWNLGQFRKKIDILSITHQSKFESKILLHIWLIWLWLTTAYHISFLLNRFSVKYRFPFPILRFLQKIHLALLKDRFLKKILLKRAKVRRHFFHKNYRLK